MIQSIQYLRFLAAALVVLYHGTQSLSKDLHSTLFETWHAGSRGVDLFFVISGFIILHVTERSNASRGAFLLRRMTRVAPLYHAATLAMLAVALVAPSLLATTRIEPGHVIASLLFIPVDHPVAFSAFPLLPVGWTLNAEAQFYVLFALLLPLAPRARAVGVGGLILGLVLVGIALRPENQTLSSWTAPILIEFVFGLILGRLWHDLPPSRRSPGGLAAALALLGVGVAGLVLVPGEATSGVLLRDLRWLLAGLPAMAVVGGLLLLDRQGRIPTVPALRLLGDASYSLYICHFFVIGLLRAVWPRAWLGTWTSEAGFLAAALALSVVAALATHLAFEKPIGRMGARRRAVAA
ncbi:acyltransferase family protein [Rubellimicrobium aerolatum]|uniref:Acyltransferase family protein n=1 Tax=Rubellimicrobium aerolatum TaxID=490979 RepID=A0ABW0SCS8_9RHOB|nr:exopolysaccharide production protein ExoZ [Rubellimicrobium aerolatum]